MFADVSYNNDFTDAWFSQTFPLTRFSKKKNKTVKALDLIIFLSEKCGNFVDCGGSVYW